MPWPQQRALVPQAGSIASVTVDLRPCPVALAHESLANDLRGATSFLMPYSPSEHTLSLGEVCPFLPLLRQEVAGSVAAAPVRGRSLLSAHPDATPAGTYFGVAHLWSYYVGTSIVF
jgi:hypothetical protein